jgi:SAM-dependent methyltransferase
MISKSLEPPDYEDLIEGLRILDYGMAAILGSGFQAYIPHQHRRWEYGSATQAYIDAFGSKDPHTILDIGCGSGPLGPALATSTGASIKEVDTDERMTKARPPMFEALELPKEKISFSVGDLRSIGNLAKYDAVFCMSVIEHIPEEGQDAAWQNLMRLVAPRGILVVTTDFGESRHRTWQADTERVYKFDPERVALVADQLTAGGFDLTLDPAYHGPQVFDYSFFRFVARKH